jgi:tyrosine-protein phosphatase YwqE
MHSHLLPGIDDGVKTAQETVYILKVLQSFGYQKIITTPHVMNEYYPNTKEGILMKLEETKEFIKRHNIDIELEAAAEYYLDESFLDRLAKNEKLLTFGDNHILFETSFLNKPVFLEEAVFNMNTQGYRPIFAHPERYSYLQNNQKLLDKLKSMNLLFQMNLLSLTGFYSADVKNFAKHLLKTNMIDFLGTDCHSALQVDEIAKKVFNKPAKLFGSQNFLNPTLL